MMLRWVLAVGLMFGVGSARAAGVLTIAQAQDPNNWDPIATFMVPWGAVASNIFDGLVLRDEQLQQPGWFASPYDPRQRALCCPLDALDWSAVGPLVASAHRLAGR